MSNQDILQENLIKALSNPRLVENKLEQFKKGKKYLASYINNEGKTVDIDITPDIDMNIVEMINTIRGQQDDFYKLFGVVEAKKESILKEIDNTDEKLEEDKPINEELTEENFKDYVTKQFEDKKDLIKDIRQDKPNNHQEWGVRVYCYDFKEPNDDKVFSGMLCYVPFDKSTEVIDKVIEQHKKNIDKVYTDEVKIIK